MLPVTSWFTCPSGDTSFSVAMRLRLRLLDFA